MDRRLVTDGCGKVKIRVKIEINLTLRYLFSAMASPDGLWGSGTLLADRLWAGAAYLIRAAVLIIVLGVLFAELGWIDADVSLSRFARK